MGAWTIEQLRTEVAAVLGVRYQRDGIKRLMKRAGFCWPKRRAGGHVGEEPPLGLRRTGEAAGWESSPGARRNLQRSRPSGL